MTAGSPTPTWSVDALVHALTGGMHCATSSTRAAAPLLPALSGLVHEQTVVTRHAILSETLEHIFVYMSLRL